MSKKIDTSGKDCPIPLMELKKALNESSDGEVIEIIFTCPEAVENLPNYIQEQGHELLDFEKKNHEGWKITVKK